MNSDSVELADRGKGVGEGREAQRGDKSYDREKAWPSINHSVLSLGRKTIKNLL